MFLRQEFCRGSVQLTIYSILFIDKVLAPNKSIFRKKFPKHQRCHAQGYILDRILKQRLQEWGPSVEPGDSSSLFQSTPGFSLQSPAKVLVHPMSQSVRENGIPVFGVWNCSCLPLLRCTWISNRFKNISPWINSRKRCLLCWGRLWC